MKDFSFHARIAMVCGGLLVLSMAVGTALLFSYQHRFAVYLALAQGAVYACAAYLLWSARGVITINAQRLFYFVIATAIAMRLLLLVAPPHSTDLYRYIWDGRVQAHGINPYEYIPVNPALSALQDDRIYPNINRKDYAPTIYPPTAQIIFFLGSRLGETVTGMKIAMLCLEAIAICAMIALLKLRNMPTYLVALYAWHPLPIWEIAGSGHVDIIATAFIWLSLWAAEKQYRILSGIMLGAATLGKYFPLSLTPSLYKRWDWKMPLAFFATALALYLPYLSAGRKIFGFLGGYANEEVGEGSGIYLVALFQKAGFSNFALPVVLLIAGISLFGLAWKSGFRTNTDKADILGAFAIAVAVTVLFSPHYPWYFIWLIPFLCFHPSPAVFWITLICPILYIIGWPLPLAGNSLIYLPFALFLLIDIIRKQVPKEAKDGHAIA